MSFGDQIRRHTAKYEKRLEATAKLSIERLVANAETLRTNGGRFRFDLGFLLASGGAALGELPRGPTDNPERKRYRQDASLSGMPLPVALAQWDFTQKLTYGWTARYARAREAKDGFMLGAVQLWPRIVKDAAREVRYRSL